MVRYELLYIAIPVGLLLIWLFKKSEMENSKPTLYRSVPDPDAIYTTDIPDDAIGYNLNDDDVIN